MTNDGQINRGRIGVSGRARTSHVSHFCRNDLEGTRPRAMQLQYSFMLGEVTVCT
jgi:hypothetical protein